MVPGPSINNEKEDGQVRGIGFHEGAAGKGEGGQDGATKREREGVREGERE